MRPSHPFTRTAILELTAGAVMARPPLQVEQKTPLADAIQRLRQPPHRLLAVIDGSGRPIGLLTHSDLIRQLVGTALADRPLELIMSRSPPCIGVGDPLLAAVTEMRRRGLEQMLVTGPDGRLVGLIRLSDALLALAGPMARLVEIMSGEETVDGLKAVKNAQPGLAEALLDDHVPAPEVLALLSEMNADLHRRTVQMLVAEMAAQGWGDPPVPFALIVMGSAGRGENALAPDQDNGLIIADYSDSQKGAVESYFAGFSERLVARLDAIGFTLCKGGVMASNPIWRRTLKGWVSEVETWLRQRQPQQLLYCDILFDFSHVAGDRRLSNTLAEAVRQLTANNKLLVKDLYAIEADHGVALGWFGRLKPNTGEDEHASGMNLKMSGTLALVEGARLLAIEAGLPERSTLARLDSLAKCGKLDSSERDGLAAAFSLVTGVLLRHQIVQWKTGLVVDDYVPTEALTAHERARLVEAFKTIAEFRAGLDAEYGRGLFG